MVTWKKQVSIAWTKRLSVGNALIDAEHRNLISMVNDVVCAIRAMDCSALSETLQLLEDWLGVHFANEERIARAVNFDFTQHRLAQTHSLKELRYLRDELAVEDGIWPEDAVKHYSSFLKKWIIDDHILRVDMLMKPLLQSQDYNLRPN